MKRKVFLTAGIIALLSGAALNAQVGINTETPQTTLDIVQADKTTNKGHGFRLADGNEGTGKYLVSDANGVGTWQAGTQFQQISDLFEVIPQNDPQINTSVPGQQGTFTIMEQESYRAGNIVYFNLKVSWLGTATVRVGTTITDFNYNPNVVDFGLVRIKSSYSQFYPFRKALFNAQVGGDENSSSQITLVDNAGATLVNSFNKYPIIASINLNATSPTYRRGWIQIEEFFYPGFAYKCPNATTPIVYYISGFYLINQPSI
ncbi:hypothetical protein FACS189429_4480 [Bacteroidia bacterium]|nr:hypothetical protein FACS189429_4480 [Bacteroidia bacterium]